MAGRSSRTPQPARIELAPLVLIKGQEGLLIDRAIAELRRQALESDPQVERTELSAAHYQSGDLAVLTSPSLFGEARLITIHDLETAPPALIDEMLAYLDAPEADVWILLIHPGGNAAGKKLTDAIAKAGYPVIPAAKITKEWEKLDLIKTQVRRANRRMEAPAMQAVVDALGDDLRAMMAAVDQLLADVEGNISVADVRRYYAGRIEAKGFDVADAVVSGDTAKALTLLRHALATGIAGPAIVGAIAMKIRVLAKVSGAPNASAAQLRMADWQLRNARKDLSGWSDRTLGRAIETLAIADEETKGASRDADYAMEKAVITICSLRRR